MLKITFFGTTTLLFDDGRDQILFDAHFTRPSIEKYIHGAFVTTNTGLCDKLIDLHHIDRLRAIFISHTHHEKAFFAETVEKTNARLVIPVHWDNFFAPLEKPVDEMPELIEKTEYVFFKLAKYCEAHDVNCLIQYPCTSIEI
jgi:L-ascorbate metabolism protein UlaG (beta-lactamase superfamily)